jgi:signal peptidase II
MYYLILIAAVALADQAIKLFVTSHFAMMSEKAIIDGFFYIHYIPNDGIAMGLLAGKQLVVIVVTGIIMLALACYIFMSRKKESPLTLAVLSIIVGGGIGNLIDRIRLGYVIDYLDFRVWDYIFNFADICVVVGCFALLFIICFDTRKRKDE